MEKIKRFVFVVARAIVKLTFPKFTVEGQEHIPEGPCVFAGNHCHMYGPIAGELYFPGEPDIWCAAEMIHLKDVPAYTYKDFWSRKPAWSKWFYKLLSYLIAPLSVCIFGNARVIPVYRDSRVMTTFRKTAQSLKNGTSVVIFPEHDAPYNHVVCDFQEGFVDVARNYYKQTGKTLPFVPMYIAPALSKVYLGEPVYFNPENPIKEERARICTYLMEHITHTALALPRHKMVPYNNVSKKEYVYNVPADSSAMP